jgi:hypothetical protein
MAVFNIAKISGEFDHHGALEVDVLNGTKGRDPFSVTLIHRAGPMAFQFSMTPDQSRDLRKALEDAESKAEILTAAI